MNDMGDRIRAFRNAFNFSQNDLAIKIGVTRATISAYENNIRCPSNEILVSLSKIYHVSTDVLLGKDTNNTIDISKLSDKNKVLIAQIVDSLEEK